MSIQLSDDRRQRLISGLRAFYKNDFDEDLSTFRAEQLIDYFVKALGPDVYNQAVQDTRAFMQARLDDLEGEVYMGESL